MNSRLAVATLASLAVGFLPGCSKSTKPKPAEYRIYVNAEPGGVQIDAYEAEDLALVDSIWAPSVHTIAPLGASPDGSSLYWIDIGGETWRPPATLLQRFDIQTRRVLWSKSIFHGWARLLGDGKIILTAGAILSAVDGSVIGTIPDSLAAYDGPASGTKIAVVMRDGMVGGLDVQTGEVWGRYQPRLASGLTLGVNIACLHPDGRRVLLIGSHDLSDKPWFVVGDLQTDQTLFESRVNSALWSQIEVSGDGALALVTDPERGINAEADPSSVSIINLNHGVVVKKITSGTGQSVGDPILSHFLPDGRHAATLWYLGDSCQLKIIDLGTGEIVNSRAIPTLWTWSVAIGRRP